MVKNLKNKSKAKTLSIVICSFVFLFIFLLSNVQGAPPVTMVQYFPEGYSIIEQQSNIFKMNEPVRYSFLLRNTTNGMTIDDTGIDCCRIIITNSQGLNLHIFNFTYNQSAKVWELELNKTEVGEVFTNVGNYNYVICCQSGSNHIGGAINGNLEMVKGDTPPTLLFIVIGYILAIFLMVYSRFVDFGEVLLFFSAIIFIVFGLLFLTFDFGLNNTALLWTFVMINWGVGLTIIFKNIGYWLEGLES